MNVSMKGFLRFRYLIAVQSQGLLMDGAVHQMRGDILGSIRAFARATDLVQASRETNARGQEMFITLYSAQLFAFLPVDGEIRDSLSNSESGNRRSCWVLTQYPTAPIPNSLNTIEAIWISPERMLETKVP